MIQKRNQRIRIGNERMEKGKYFESGKKCFGNVKKRRERLKSGRIKDIKEVEKSIKRQRRSETWRESKK